MKVEAQIIQRKWEERRVILIDVANKAYSYVQYEMAKSNPAITEADIKAHKEGWGGRKFVDIREEAVRVALAQAGVDNLCEREMVRELVIDKFLFGTFPWDEGGEYHGAWRKSGWED